MSGKGRWHISPSFLNEIDHYIFTYSKEFAGKIIVRTSSGKTISIEGDKKKERSVNFG